ncbi:hypothetical protein ACS0TY_016286 [Phlomoides rotata]
MAKKSSLSVLDLNDIVEISSDSDEPSSMFPSKTLHNDEKVSPGIFPNPHIDQIQDTMISSSALAAEEEAQDLRRKCLGYGIRLTNFSSFSESDESRIRSWFRSPRMEI